MESERARENARLKVDIKRNISMPAKPAFQWRTGRLRHERTDDENLVNDRRYRTRMQSKYRRLPSTLRTFSTGSGNRPALATCHPLLSRSDTINKLAA